MNDIAPFGDFEKEVAKSFGEESAKSLFGFMKAIVQPPAEEFGELLRDTVKYFRFKNQAKILLKASQFVQKGKQEITRPVHLKLLSRVLDDGGNEDDQSLQDMWAALLVSSVTHFSLRFDLSVSYADILRQLSPQDARVLDILYRFYHSYSDTAKDMSRSLKKSDFTGMFYDDVEFLLVADNLKRLNVVDSGEDEFEIHLTTLGLYFVDACTPEHVRNGIYNPAF